MSGVERDIATIVAGVRHSFDRGITRPESWRRAQLQALKRMLLERGDDFERALAHDLGKSGVESQLTELGFVIGEVDYALRHLSKWIAPRAVGVPLALQPATARVRAEPLGVALIIAPWNYPVSMVLSPLVGALAAGNAVVATPSELTPATSAALARIVPEYLDRRAIAVVEGGIDETTALLAQRFDHIFFTGSTRVARIVARAAAEQLTPVTLELGGKSPAYLDDSVPLAAVAQRLAWSKFVNAGQTCVAPDYVLGSERVLRKLVPHLREAIHRLYGSAIQRNPDYGRIVNAPHFERLLGFLGDGEIVIGGQHDADDRFLAPTVLAGVDRESPVMREEIFGPILPLVEVRDLDDALTFVTGRDKPLAAYVFSEDPVVRRRWELETSSGGLSYGAPILQLTVPELPFGGVGPSGMGAYHGERSFLTFSHEKAVLSKPLRPDTLGPTVMPPFTPQKEALVRGPLGRLR